MNNFSDKKIVDSWRKNATPWATAIRNNEIESRSLVTNDSVINAIVKKAPKSVLDIGCGEGWLVRELEARGIRSTGIDVTNELIEHARNSGDGSFQVLSYEEISPNTIQDKFDAIVCNFSLLGNESVNLVFHQIASLLNDSGVFIIQTIHPISACGEEMYEDGWRKGSWAGFSDEFTDPAPWYFRTVDSWKDLFLNNNLSLIEIIEPLNRKTKEYVSIIFTAVKYS